MLAGRRCGKDRRNAEHSETGRERERALGKAELCQRDLSSFPSKRIIQKERSVKQRAGEAKRCAMPGAELKPKTTVSQIKNWLGKTFNMRV